MYDAPLALRELGARIGDVPIDQISTEDLCLCRKHHKIVMRFFFEVVIPFPLHILACDCSAEWRRRKFAWLLWLAKHHGRTVKVFGLGGMEITATLACALAPLDRWRVGGENGMIDFSADGIDRIDETACVIYLMGAKTAAAPA